MARLFLAINLPAGVKKTLARLQDELARLGADVRWVRPEGIHLTLKFLGEVPESKIEQITQMAQKAVEESGLKSLRLGIKGLGTFPSGRSPRVVWVGLTGDLKELASLQNIIEEKMSLLGFEKEKRAFIPHITLGRVKSSRQKEALVKEIYRRREEEILPQGELVVSEIILYKSTLHPKGAIYSPLKCIPFSN